MVRAAAPGLVELHGVGIELAGQFLVTTGDNADRIHSEAAFAKLCGVAPNRPAAEEPPADTASTEARRRTDVGTSGRKPRA
ncbi:transposase [Amycolatopsis acidiphila]|uniref:transposase n=1 Tax=Amycolatopsis acidiphila TaxID=715473 RepID=UPI003570CC88